MGGYGFGFGVRGSPLLRVMFMFYGYGIRVPRRWGVQVQGVGWGSWGYHCSGAVEQMSQTPSIHLRERDLH